MNIFCIIPARGGSKAIPGKNIIDFCGKPLIAWTIEQALASRHVRDVYVSSDDADILKVARIYGAKTILRPASLATDTSTSEAALQHALDQLQKRGQADFDAVLFLQPTSPLRLQSDIDKALNLFFTKKADALFSSAVLDDCCIWKCPGEHWESVSFDYKNRGRRQDREPYYWENGSIYIFRPETLKKYGNRLGGKIVTYPMPLWQFYEVDKSEDVEICEYFMRTKILSFLENKKILRQNVKLIVYDFDGVLTNNSVIVREDGLESVSVSRADGLAISIFKRNSIRQMILTTEINKVVQARARKLDIPILRGICDKKSVLKEHCRKNKIPLKKVLYVGDDVNDLEAMKLVGIPVCPANAASEIKKIAKIVLPVAGGQGAVRSLLSYFDIHH